MKSLHDILDAAHGERRGIPSAASAWMIEHGYIKTEVYGWEKPEYLEMFGLNLDATGIPCQLTDEVDFKEVKRSVKNEFGEKTGNEIVREKVFTGRKIWTPIPAYLEFRKFKKHLYAEWYARRFNEPPPEYSEV